MRTFRILVNIRVLQQNVQNFAQIFLLSIAQFYRRLTKFTNVQAESLWSFYSWLEFHKNNVDTQKLYSLTMPRLPWSKNGLRSSSLFRKPSMSHFIIPTPATTPTICSTQFWWNGRLELSSLRREKLSFSEVAYFQKLHKNTTQSYLQVVINDLDLQAGLDRVGLFDAAKSAPFAFYWG